MTFKRFYDTLSIPSNKERRSSLIKKMGGLKNSGINCQSCKGVCCTFIANSMKATPIEALELAVFLEENGRITESLIENLQNTIKHYRLDYDIDTGMGTSIRRTYTCPFYNEGPKGCSISPEYKPYGCLGFNAFDPNAQDGDKCAPDFDLLEERELLFSQQESEIGKLITEKYKIHSTKLPMPIMLLKIVLNK